MNEAEKPKPTNDLAPQEMPAEQPGLGSALNITEQDWIRSSIEDKSSARVAFERLENFAKEKAQRAKESIKENVKGAWNGARDKSVELVGRGKNWLDQNWNRVKTVSKEWTGDVVETIKLNTVDKWRVLNEKDEYNRLTQRKVQDIQNVAGRIETENQNIAGFEASQAADDKKFTDALESMTNPAFREVFERNQRERLASWEAQKQEAQGRIEEFNEQNRNHAREIVDFHFNVKQSGERFAERLDTKIEAIETKYGYAEKKSYLENVEQLIDENQNAIKGINNNILEHVHHLKLGRQLGLNPDDLKVMEGGIQDLITQREWAEHRIEEFVKEKANTEKALAKIDKKTARYRKIKSDMGLDNIDEILGVESTTDTGDVEATGDVDSPEEDVDAGTAETVEGVDDVDDTDPNVVTSSEDATVEEGLDTENVENPATAVAEDREDAYENSDEDAPRNMYKNDRVGKDGQDIAEYPENATSTRQEQTKPAPASGAKPAPSPAPKNEQADSKIESDNESEGDDESLEAEIDAEAFEDTTDAANKLVKVINRKNMKVADVIGAVGHLKDMLVRYKKEIDPDEVAGLMKGINSILEDYPMKDFRHDSGGAVERGLKQDVKKNVIRRLPRWLTLE